MATSSKGPTPRCHVRARVSETAVCRFLSCLVIIAISHKTVVAFLRQSNGPKLTSTRQQFIGHSILALDQPYDNLFNNDDDLTKEELSLRLSEVREYYRQTNEMSQQDICLSLLRTRFPKLRLNRCFVGPSNLPDAGRGLFASRDITDGELITLYPGDALLVWNETVGDFGPGIGVMFGSHVTDRDARRVSTDDARNFELKIGSTWSLVADPNLTEDPAYMGHMVNDGAILRQRHDAARELYAKTTIARHNAAFVELESSHYVVMATKRILKEEEIFVSYGEGYWISRSYLEANEATASTRPGDADNRGEARNNAKNGDNVQSIDRSSSSRNARTDETQSKEKKQPPMKKGFGK